MTLQRRDVLLKVAAVAGLEFASRQVVAAGIVRLMCGYGIGNPTDLCAQLIQDGLSAALDEPVEFDYALGDAGRSAARYVIDSRPDGKTLLIAEVLNLVLQDTPADPLLSRLVPIAKITRGFSTAIVVNQYSGVADWAGLLAAARTGRLKAATTGLDSTVGLLLALIEQRTRLSFDLVETESTKGAVDLLLTRRAELAVVDTRLAVLHNRRDSTKLRVIATSGARRSPELPQVPTLAELVGDPKLAYTISYGVFAPATTASATAARLTAALLGMRDDKTLQAQARLADIPVQIDGPSAVLETIARDRRVAENIGR